MSNLLVYFCFSTQPPNPGAQVPSWATPRICFQNFISIFGTQNVIVIADSSTSSDLTWLQTKVSQSQIYQTSFGESWIISTFLKAVDLSQAKSDDSIIYITNSNFIHQPNARQILFLGLSIGDYVTGYDAPSKYVNSSSVSSSQTVGGYYVWNRSEVCNVFCPGTYHFMSFRDTVPCVLAKASSFKQDKSVFQTLATSENYRVNSVVWRTLMNKGRRLINALPSVSTSATLPFFAPTVDWQQVLTKNS